MYFATLHKEASLVLAEVAHQLGQRALVGKVSMDLNSPDYYIEETGKALIDAEDFIVSLQSRKVHTEKRLEFSTFLAFQLLISILSIRE